MTPFVYNPERPTTPPRRPAPFSTMAPARPLRSADEPVMPRAAARLSSASAATSSTVSAAPTASASTVLLTPMKPKAKVVDVANTATP